MRRISVAVTALAIATAAFAATKPLFDSATESKWSVTKGGKETATVTLLTSATGTRAEWRTSAKSPVTVFLGSRGKVWVRQSGGDVELAQYKGGADAAVVPALVFTDSAAKYTRDAKGPVSIDVNGYTLTRTSLSSSKADASNFVVRPRKTAASRLASLTGDLLGPSQSTASATAGGRGVGTKGLKLADGGDYGAVEAVENRDAAWAAKMDEALRVFQKEGNVGKGRDE